MANSQLWCPPLKELAFLFIRPRIRIYAETDVAFTDPANGPERSSISAKVSSRDTEKVSPSSPVLAGERYTLARKTEFLLNNAATEAEYLLAREEVESLRIDPDSIPHTWPSSR